MNKNIILLVIAVIIVSLFIITVQNANVKKIASKENTTYVNILKNRDIEVVILDNNHSEDYFKEGMNDTKFILDENNIKDIFTYKWFIL